MKRILLALLLTVAACSSDDDPETAEATTTTEAAAAETVTVRLVAEVVGLSCAGTTPIGNGSQLVILDPAGTRLGVGTFQLSPGLTPGVDTCDWTAEVPDVEPGHDLYVLEADGEELATVDLVEADWQVVLLADGSGVAVQ